MADPTPIAVSPARPEPPRLLESLSRLFGPFLTLFGSVAAVTAALVFAGFLSDYGAYRLAGLPRLNLNVTGLAEQGADALIDSLALLAGGMRWLVIALLLLGLLALWGWHDAPRLRPWARSSAVHSAARLVLLVFAVLLTSAMVERAQRSLSGAHYGQQALEDALSIVYAPPWLQLPGHDPFPSPYDRQLEIERQTYELGKYVLDKQPVQPQSVRRRVSRRCSLRRRYVACPYATPADRDRHIATQQAATSSEARMAYAFCLLLFFAGAAFVGLCGLCGV